MTRSRNDFRLEHAGEIREALIDLEGEDGAFELLWHGRLAGRSEAAGALYAVVRSCGTGRVHMLAEDQSRQEWHPIRDDIFAAA